MRTPSLRPAALATLALLATACGTAQPAARRPDPPRGATAGPIDPPRATAVPVDPPRATAVERLPPPVGAVLERHFRVRAGVVALATADGSLWVSGSGAISRIDPATGRLLARIATPSAGDLTHMAIGEGSVWATGDYDASVVYRIDPVTDRVAATISTPGPALGIAVGGGRVWVAIDREGPGEVIGIDPRTDRVTGAPIEVGTGPGQLVYGDGALWVENTAPASVMRIDPAAGRAVPIIGPVVVNYGATVLGAIAVGYGSLWSTANDHLTRLNPKTDQVTANLRIPRGNEVALAAGEAWVLAEPRSTSAATFHPVRHTAALYEVDPRDDGPVGKPVRLDAEEPIALTATDERLWVGDYTTETVTELRLVPRHAGPRLTQGGSLHPR